MYNRSNETIADKVILVDVDGVLLDWEYAFTGWMQKHNYEIQEGMEDQYDMTLRYGLKVEDKERIVRMFNESAWIRKLPPLRDAIKYVRKLHEEQGYVFRVISSLSDCYYSQHLRTKNLIEMFGPSVFEKYTYLDTGADKDEALSEYKDTQCYWVEDKIKNAEVGYDLGLKSILVEHTHNKDYSNNNIPVLKNWKEIYNSIV